MKRKGMGKGTGKGYRNLVGKDPMVHSQSAKGMKQPQKVDMLRERNIFPKLIVMDSFNNPVRRTISSVSEMKQLAKNYLRINKKIGLDVDYTLKDLDKPINSLLYLKRIGVVLESNVTGVNPDGSLSVKPTELETHNDLPMSKKKKMTKKNNLKDTDKDGVGDVLDCDPLDPNKQDDTIEEIEQKNVELRQKIEQAKVQIQKRILEIQKQKAELSIKKELKSEEKKLLEELKSEEKELNELNESEVVKKAKDLGKKTGSFIVEKSKAGASKLADLSRRGLSYIGELNRKHKEDKEAFNNEVVNLSNNELKQLAVRYRGSGSGLFGGTDNPYEKELVRRIEAEKTISKEIDKAKSDKKEPSIFDL